MNASKIKQAVLRRAPEAAREKPALDRAALSEIVELALWAGQLLMENGAETQRVEESVRSVGLGLGCDWGNVLITHGAIIVTYVGGGDFRTKIRSVRSGPVNMALIEALSHLVHRADLHTLSIDQVRAELSRIEGTGRAYVEWQTVLAGGLGCAAFCRIFNGDWAALGTTFVASSAATYVRSTLSKNGHNPLIVAGVTAIAASTLVGIVHLRGTPEAALAASVILLVPGPAAINAVEDLIKGHIVVGLSRATFAALILVFATLGLMAAMQLTRISL